MVAALLWLAVGFHWGASLGQQEGSAPAQPETLAALAALKQRVVELEQRWSLALGHSDAPAPQAPLPPYPWGDNAPPMNTATSVNPVR